MFLPLLILLVQGSPVRTSNSPNPLQTLTDYLTVLTERGCLGEVIHITCDPGNKVSIQSVVVGSEKEGEGSCQAGRGGSEECQAQSEGGEVQTLCQGRSQCKVQVTPSLLQSQALLCPREYSRKYLEVKYQCRPARFRSRTVCRDDSDSLSCQASNHGLVILSSSFLSVSSNNFYCPSLGPSQDSELEQESECLKSEVNPGVIQRCHGHQNCSIKADPLVLGSPACRQFNVFLKVIYACVTRGNIRTLNKDLNSNQIQAGSGTDFTTMSLNIQTSPAPVTRVLNREIIEALIEEEEDNEGIIEMETEITDKKLIFSSELKLEPQSDGGAPDRPRDYPADRESGEQHNFQDPQFLTILITSAVSVVTVTLGLAVILSLSCRRKTETSNSTTSSSNPASPRLTNLDTVSLESQELQLRPDTKNVTFTTFQNTGSSLLLPSSASPPLLFPPSSSSSQTTEISTASSQLHLETIKTLDEKYGLVSSTPNTNKIMLANRREKLETFSQTTLLGSQSISESSELRRMSADFRDEQEFGNERLQRSFDHFSGCECESSTCHRNQNNLTVLI